MTRLSRRRFLTVTGGLLATGCTGVGRDAASGRADATAPTTTAPTTTVPGATVSPVTSTTSPVVVTSVSVPPELVTDDRVLVMVELAGGNDAVNTLPPLTGGYRDLRPTIALPEAELVTPRQLAGHALHPSLAPLTSMLDAGRLAVVAAIGFPDPDRSHFVSTDRWLRADRMDETQGWLGRWLDLLPEGLPVLGATALGGGGKMLRGSARSGVVIDEADAFAFPAGLSNASIRALTDPLSTEPLHAAAQQAFAASIGAVEEFDVIADAVRRATPQSDDDLVPPAGAFSTGLAVAAQLIVGGVGTRVVTVRAQGFDTHGDQLAIHADLLDDLAVGLTSFWATVDDAGLGERVLLATHSEFGRRVRENASGGTDHGAAGVCLLIGDSVRAGLHGSIDTADLLDGDLRPQIDPRAMFTACLDWLGADVETILGRRYDDVALLA